MDNLIGHILTVFMGFFAIMNPIANTPIFLGLTADDDRATSKLVARNSLALAFIIVAIFSVAGHFIFQMFGIGLPAFQITGGILVFLIGFHMLQGNNSSVHHLDEDGNKKCLEAQLSVAISPLAMPILAGPGTLATAMNFSQGGLQTILITVLCYGALCVISYLFFISGGRFVKFLGEGGLSVITRMMGLILAVIGTQMIIEGVTAVIHSL